VFVKVLNLMLAGLVAVGCSASAVGDLQRFQKALQSRFQVSPPGVELRNGNLLLIAFEDSGFARMDSTDRSEHAQTVAAFARDSFPAFSRLSTITIGYVALTRKGGVTNRTIYDVKSYRAPNLVTVQPRFQ
jgi:hypothetical protein